MKHFVGFCMSGTGRWLRGLIGFGFMAWGYSYYEFPDNLWLIAVGLLITLLALFDIMLLAGLFGYPVRGKAFRERYKTHKPLPGEERD